MGSLCYPSNSLISPWFGSTFNSLLFLASGTPIPPMAIWLPLSPLSLWHLLWLLSLNCTQLLSVHLHCWSPWSCIVGLFFYSTYHIMSSGLFSTSLILFLVWPNLLFTPSYLFISIIYLFLGALFFFFFKHVWSFWWSLLPHFFIPSFIFLNTVNIFYFIFSI